MSIVHMGTKIYLGQRCINGVEGQWWIMEKYTIIISSMSFSGIPWSTIILPLHPLLARASPKFHYPQMQPKQHLMWTEDGVWALH
jgi:hypothetical protein